MNNVRDEILSYVPHLDWLGMNFLFITDVTARSGHKLHVHGTSTADVSLALARVLDTVLERGIIAKVGTRRFFESEPGSGIPHTKALTLYMPRPETALDDMEAVVRAMEGYPHALPIPGDEYIASGVSYRFEFRSDPGRAVSPRTAAYGLYHGAASQIRAVALPPPAGLPLGGVHPFPVELLARVTADELRHRVGFEVAGKEPPVPAPGQPQDSGVRPPATRQPGGVRVLPPGVDPRHGGVRAMPVDLDGHHSGPAQPASSHRAPQPSPPHSGTPRAITPLPASSPARPQAARGGSSTPAAKPARDVVT